MGIETNENVKMIVEALQIVQGKCTRAQKDGRNEHQNYAYVSEEGLVELVRDAFIEAGLILTPSVGPQAFHVEHRLGKSENQHIVVWEQQFHLAHISGAIWPFPLSVICEGADSGDKAVWKGLTNAHKHILLKLLMLPTGDEPEADERTDQDFSSSAPPKRLVRRPNPAPAARGGSKVSPPKRQPSDSPSVGEDVLAWVEEVGSDYELGKEDFKAWGVWTDNFKATEAVFGKPIPEGVSKFECMDDFKAQEGIGKNDPFCAFQLPKWKAFVNGGWHQFGQPAPTEDGLDDGGPF